MSIAVAVNALVWAVCIFETIAIVGLEGSILRQAKITLLLTSFVDFHHSIGFGPLSQGFQQFRERPVTPVPFNVFTQ